MDTNEISADQQQPQPFVANLTRKQSTIPFQDPEIIVPQRRVSLMPVPMQPLIAPPPNPRVSIVPGVPTYRPAVMFQSLPRPVLQPGPVRTLVRVPVPMRSARSPSIAPDSKFVDTDHVYMVFIYKLTQTF